MLRIQGSRHYHDWPPNGIFPVFVLHHGDNNEHALMKIIAQVLDIRMETMSLQNFDKDIGSHKLYKHPPAFVVFDLLTFMNNDTEANQFISLLMSNGYLSTDVDSQKYDYSFLFSELSHDGSIEEIRRILFQNLFVIMVKIPESFNGGLKSSPKEIARQLIDYYVEKSQRLGSAPDNTVHLLNLINNNNTVIFENPDYQSLYYYTKKHFEKRELFKDVIQAKIDFMLAFNLAILQSDNFDLKSTINSMEHFLSNLKGHLKVDEDLKIQIQCENPDIKPLFQSYDDFETAVKHFEPIIKKLNKTQTYYSFDVIHNEGEPSILITNFMGQYQNYQVNSAYLEETPSINFQNVVGMQKVKDRFNMIKSFYENPDMFKRYGAQPVNRILLAGEPGTGKTFVAKAFAGEIKLPFFSISASEITSQKYAGEGGTLLRDLFNKAKQMKPCIVFFDELDAFGNRENFQEGSVGYDAKAILNTFLVFLDGMSSDNDIIIGATNRVEDLDRALLRPKRFGTIIKTDGLTFDERKAMIQLHLDSSDCGDDYDAIFDFILSKTDEDTTPAIIEDIINEAKLIAIQNHEEELKLYHFEEVIENLIRGDRIGHITPKFKKTIAYHQSGRLIVHKLLIDFIGINEVSVSIREKSLGYLNLSSDGFSFEQLNPEHLIRIAIATISGAIAEHIKFGYWGLHAESDWEAAVFLLNKVIGNIELSNHDGDNILENALADDHYISESFKILLNKAMSFCKNEARRLLENNWTDVEIIAGRLIEKESLNKAEFERFLNLNQPLSESYLNLLIEQIES